VTGDPETAKNSGQPNNPLHGVKLEAILEYLVEHVGWIEMNRRVRINCFFSNPSVRSSLKFLRKNNWARIEVERMYLDLIASPDTPNRDFHGDQNECLFE
jgi:uncharacterized protein (DUF2132 family)